jgi:ABC-type antimicrobial peptide transport system permease subunit
LGILVSVGVGLLAGFLPARSASKLNPVDAMRSK